MTLIFHTYPRIFKPGLHFTSMVFLFHFLHSSNQNNNSKTTQNDWRSDLQPPASNVKFIAKNYVPYLDLKCSQYHFQPVIYSLKRLSNIKLVAKNYALCFDLKSSHALCSNNRLSYISNSQCNLRS